MENNMIVEKEKYTLIPFDDGSRTFGFIHKGVKKEERLALQAVLKEQGVFDITDIWTLNAKKLQNAEKIETNINAYSIEFDNFYFVVHEFSGNKRPICFISTHNVIWSIHHLEILKSDKLSSFIERKISESKLFNAPLYRGKLNEDNDTQSLIYSSGRIVLQKKNFTVIKLGAYTDYVFSFGELVLINENGKITELKHTVSKSTSRHINEYKRMIGNETK